MDPKLKQTISRDEMVSDACWVCGVRFKISVPPGNANRELHHLYPRNAGGTDGPIVSLCERDHSSLHKIAERIHGTRSYNDMLVTETPLASRRLVYLAICVVRAERIARADPNKYTRGGFSFTPDQMKILEILQKRFPNRSRTDIIAAALKNLLIASQ